MLGEKRIETRSMLFKYRGPVAIHAALSEPDPSWRTVADHPFRRALTRHGVESGDLAYGAVLGLVDFIDGCRFDAVSWPIPDAWLNRTGVDEQHFGDYRAGRAGILMANPRPFPLPIQARGMNGLWNWEPPKGLFG